MDQLTPTQANLRRHRPTYPDIGQVGPCVTKSAVSQTVSYVTTALPFMNISNLGNIWTLGLKP